jgi:hypothetical protein
MIYQNRSRLGFIQSGSAGHGFVILGPEATEADKITASRINQEVQAGAARKYGGEATAAARDAVQILRKKVEEKKGILIPLVLAGVVAGVVIAKNKKKKRRGR